MPKIENVLVQKVTQLQAQVARLSRAKHGSWVAGWQEAIETWVFASATTFTITDDEDAYGEDDFTAKYQAGDFIRFKQAGAYLYFMITAVAYADPTTTVTVTKNITGGGSDIANAAITDPGYSKMFSPQGCGPAYVFTPGYYTSTSWDGDAKNGADGTIDLSAAFGVPAGVKAVSVLLVFTDETAQIVAYLYTPGGNIYSGITQFLPVASTYISAAGIVPCDANGDIYWAQSGEIDHVYIWINGYWS